MSGLGAYVMVVEVSGGEPAGGSGFDLVGGASGVRDAVARWLRLVAADVELAPFLVGVDEARLGGHLALVLTLALGGPCGDFVRPAETGVWRGLGLGEGQHRRIVDYLSGVLWAMGLPAGVVGSVVRVFADEVGR